MLQSLVGFTKAQFLVAETIYSPKRTVTIALTSPKGNKMLTMKQGLSLAQPKTNINKNKGCPQPLVGISTGILSLFLVLVAARSARCCIHTVLLEIISMAVHLVDKTQMVER